MSPTEFVRERRVVLAAGKHPIPTLAEFIAGEAVRGDWWSHPKGPAIFAALQKLDREPEVRVCRLVAGRVTFVHASIWPPVVRVAGDASRIRRAARLLPAAAKRLLEEVERAAQAGLRTDVVSARLRDGRRHLERALLVQTDEVHTDAGRHAAVLRAWAHVGSVRERRAAASLSLEEATDALVAALVHSSGTRSEKELWRWLPLPPEEVSFAFRRISRAGGRG